MMLNLFSRKGSSVAHSAAMYTTLSSFSLFLFSFLHFFPRVLLVLLLILLLLLLLPSPSSRDRPMIMLVQEGGLREAIRLPSAERG